MSLNVAIQYKVHKDLTLEVDLSVGDECCVVFGPSGAGKSTLLRLIAGLERPDSGSITLHGEPLFDDRAKIDRPLRTRKIGVIYQEDLLFPHLNVAKNISFGLKGGVDIAKRVVEIAKLCGVTHLLDRSPATLSGGERQRVGLARALAPRPKLLLCDEPVSALDHEGRLELIARLAEVRRLEEIPTIHVTHSPTEALALGSSMIVMEAGRVVDRGKPVEVLGRQRGKARTDWSEARNLFHGVIESLADDETLIRIEEGPSLRVRRMDQAIGSSVVVAIRADDILLARGRLEGLSARNVLAGRIREIVAHDFEAEVLVEVGSTTWAVSVMASGLSDLGLKPGEEVYMIIKGRSCHILHAGD